MNETSESPGRSFGVPFWMGYVVSSVGWFLLLAKLQLLDLDEHLEFWLYAGVALGVVGPFGGMFFQAAHDLVLAVWRGQLRLWHIALLLAIVVASFVVGYINYLHGDGFTLWIPW